MSNYTNCYVLGKMTEPATTVTQEVAQPPPIAGIANLITPFNGTHPNVFVEDFLQEIDDVSRMGHWKPQDKIIIVKNKLRGLVVECVNEEDSLKGVTDYELFKNYLLEKIWDKEINLWQ